MDKTIKQIAEELNASKQAVYKRYKGKLYTEVHPYTHTVNSTVYISEQGQNIIKSDFTGDAAYSKDTVGAHTEVYTDAHTEYTPKIDNSLQGILKILQEQLTEKDKLIQQLQLESQKQNEHSRQQSDKLINLLEQNNKLQENNQVLIARQQQTEQIPEHAEAVTKTNQEVEEEPTPKKQSFFQKIFG